MKKTIAMLTAMMMTAAIAVPMTAFADTTIVPKGTVGEVFDATPTPGTANATVNLNIDPAYTVTIPASFDLTNTTNEGIKTGSGNISAENVFLTEDKVITVTLTSASKFEMAAATGSYKLPYTVTGAFGAITDKTAGGKVAEFNTAEEAQNVMLNFSTDVAPQFAGSYSDPVVFHIALADKVTTQTMTIRGSDLMASGSVTVTYTPGQKWSEATFSDLTGEVDGVPCTYSFGWNEGEEYFTDSGYYWYLAKANGDPVGYDEQIDADENYRLEYFDF